MKTLTQLREELSGVIYVHCATEEQSKKFLEAAHSEGFRFGSLKPDFSHIDDLYSLKADKKLAHPNFVGRMLYGSKAQSCGDEPFYRIEFGSYFEEQS